MDYEKKYYIALDKARLLHHNLVKYGVKIITKDIEDIFPELKESENKRMIQYFKDLAPFDKADELYEKYGFSHKDAIDWLEKQKGTEREIEGNSLCKIEQKPVEEYSFNIESELFHQLTLAQQVLWRKEIEQAYNAGADTQKPAWSEEDELHIRELESLVKRVWATAERENDKDTIHKMSDLSFFLKTLKPQLKQEWSEEDEKQARQIERIVHNDGCTQKLQKQIADWLKSLKDRCLPQPKQEWSEKDEKIRSSIIDFIRYELNHNAYIGTAGVNSARQIEWLKSLRPKKQWKPDGDQLDALYDMIRSFKKESSYSNRDDIANIVDTLFEQLKAL